MKRIFSIALSVFLACVAGFGPAQALDARVKGPQPTVYQPQRACLTEEAMLKKVVLGQPTLRWIIQHCSSTENVEDCLVLKLRARDEQRKNQLTNLILLGIVRERLPELRFIIGLQTAQAESSGEEEAALKLRRVNELSDEAIRSFDDTIAYMNKRLRDGE